MSQLRRKRILFIAEAVTLAHATRPFVLAQALDPAEYEVYFACASRFQFICASAPFRCLDLNSISHESFLAALSAGTRLYSRATLETYVHDDLKLIQSVQPDVIVGDFRLSLAVSAQLAGVPHIALANAYWSPYTVRREFPVPDLSFARVTGVPVAAKLFGLTQRLIFAYHATPLNAVRKKFGLAPLAGLLDAYTYGDYTLYADLPKLFPTAQLPSHHRYLGPVLWSPAIPVKDAPEDGGNERPLIYISLGSSGATNVLPKVIAAVERLPVTALVATAGRVALGRTPANVSVADYLPGDKLCEIARMVICNGGSPAVYQALAKGTPVIGIASNLDQFLCMSGVENMNAGILLRASHTTRRSITNAIETMIDHPLYRQSAQNLAAQISATDAVRTFRSLLQEIHKD